MPSPDPPAGATPPAQQPFNPQGSTTGVSKELTEPAKKPAGCFSRFVSAAVLCHTVCVALLFISMELFGERCWPIAVLLYLPQRVFLLPLIVFIPAALLAEVPIGTYAAMGLSAILFLWHVPFYIGMGANAENLELKVMTNNFGQNHHLSISPFIASENPDIVALDEAQYDQELLRRENPGFTLVQCDQFVLLSKAPVKSATALPWPRWNGQAVAAVFDVTVRGKDVAIYAVHLPTPRLDFDNLINGGLYRGPASRPSFGAGLPAFTQSMDARVRLGHDLASVFAKEKRPFVALGDFNMPSDGYVRREVSWGLVDCFEQGGRGFGFTFPGDVTNPLTSNEPWLRIDYIFADPGWRVVDCSVEPARRSQHRAVVATLTRN